jgi:oligo-1,6-glucosidase
VQSFPDAPNPDNKPYVFAPQYFIHGPRILEFYDEMKREVLSKYDIMTVGEAALTTTRDAAAVTHFETGYLNMVFTFEHTDIDMERHSFATKWHAVPFELKKLKVVKSRWQDAMADVGWNSLYFNNHDQPRAVSRFGDAQNFRRESATMLATFLHTLQGTPYVYQGEEIGMTNVFFPSIADYRDIESINGFRELIENQGFSPEAALKKVQFRSRDNARTPMQWDASPNAGFTTGKPWLALNPNFSTINVEAELADPQSIFHYYQTLIRLRKEHKILVYGRYDLIEDDHESIYAYTRTLVDEKLLVVINFSGGTPDFAAPKGLTFQNHELLIGNYPVAAEQNPLRFALRPYEARVYRFW